MFEGGGETGVFKRVGWFGKASALDCPIFTTALARVGIRGPSLLWNGVG